MRLLWEHFGRKGMTLGNPDSLPECLEQALARRQPKAHPEWQAKPAAILIPLYRERGVWHLLFTRRTDSVDSHKGQVSFPGGLIEPQDQTPVLAALREAEEELGLRRQDVRVLGTMDAHLTVTDFVISPVVGIIPWPYPLQINKAEVAVAFGVPLTWLADPANLQDEHPLMHHSGSDLTVYYFKPFEGEVIWGATARITLDFIQMLTEPLE
jgi:8-oxo-dGTP pyrophosphatase MutT (NUDIX family)